MNFLVDEAESLLLHQWQRSPKIIALLRALIQPLQEAADTLQLLDDGRYIDEAEGERLDMLGRLVKQPRNNMTDADYIAWIRARIRLNISHGRAEDVLGILDILFKKREVEFYMDEYKANDVVFTFMDTPKVPIRPLVDIIKASVPVNTACHFKMADKKPLFRFDVAGFGGHLADFYTGDKI